MKKKFANLLVALVCVMSISFSVFAAYTYSYSSTLWVSSSVEGSARQYSGTRIGITLNDLYLYMSSPMGYTSDILYVTLYKQNTFSKTQIGSTYSTSVGTGARDVSTSWAISSSGNYRFGFTKGTTTGTNVYFTSNDVDMYSW